MSRDLTREEVLAKRKAERAAAKLLPPDEPERAPAEPPPGHPAHGETGTRRYKNGHANGHDTAAPAVPFFDLGHAGVQRWRDVELAPMEFTVAELLPHNTAWLIGGDSGSGKSILMQTLCTCVAADLPFLGRAVRFGRAIYLTGEDRDEILHARQLRINKALGISWDDIGDNLLVRSMADKEMWLFNDQGPTSAGLQMVDEITKLGGETSVAVIDSASLTFDAEEIKRRPVADFMRYLNRAAATIKGSIGLVAHTSRSSKGDARSMVSGSTAWVAQSRAGLLLEAQGTDEAKLSLIAPNYTRRIEPITLDWNEDGVLLPQPPRGIVDNIEDQRDGKLILREIEAQWVAGAPLSLDARTGARYLPPIVAARHRIKPGDAERITRQMMLKGDIIEGIRKRKTGLRLSLSKEVENGA